MSDVEVNDLELISVIGFDGATVRGLNIHPDGLHIVYPLGCKVVVQNWKTKNQVFLSGHTNAISAIAISPNGKYIASGQITDMGFKAPVIVWNFETSQLVSKYDSHKVRVESITFSCDSKYLTSLGGHDDSNIIVWNVEKGEAVCYAMASRRASGKPALLCRTNLRGQCFVTGGDGTSRVWKIIPDKKQAEAVDVKFGLIKRNIVSMAIDEVDMFAFCGTSTGDIVKIKLNYDSDVDILDPITNPVLLGCFGKCVKTKRWAAGEEPARYHQGVTALCLWPCATECRIIVGAGDGTVELVREVDSVTLPESAAARKIRMPCIPRLLVLKSTSVDCTATSLQLQNTTVFVGTILSEIFTIDLETFEVKLHITCHRHAICDIAFPHEYSEVFATCSKHDIRVWNTETSLELLRITVPNFTCTGIQFSCDGKFIISGWNDGEIRAFTPQTGRLIYEIHNAHSKGVTAIAVTASGEHIVSGGGEGQRYDIEKGVSIMSDVLALRLPNEFVMIGAGAHTYWVRVWQIKPTYQKLEGILQGHRGPVSCIRISSSNTEAVSASSDGTCVIWDIVKLTRKQSLFANTHFTAICYHPSGVQIVTTGTDCKIGYWEVYDGSLVREIDGSRSSVLNAIDISRDGERVLTGGDDKYVKVWNYRNGNATHVGTGHAGAVTAVRLSPDNRHIVSVSSDGGIFRWKTPYIAQPLQESQPPTRRSSRSTREGMEEQREFAPEEEVQENIEQAAAMTSARSEHGSKDGGNGETQGICIFEEEDGKRVKNFITKDRKGTPEHDGTLKNAGTPKSGGTSKSVGTPECNVTPKSVGTPERNGTPKSTGTSKCVGTPQCNVTPKSGGTPEHNVRLKSGGTPGHNGMLKSLGTRKSSRTSNSSISPNSGSMLKSNVTPKNGGIKRHTGATQIGGMQNVSNRSNKKV